MDDDEQIQALIRRAQSAVQELDETLKPIAFRAVLEKLLRAEEAGDTTAAKLTKSTSVPANLNEFLAIKAPKTHVDRVTTVAFYSLHSGNEEGVTVDEVFEGYSRARVPKPKNIHDVIAQCVRRGFLIEADSKKDGVKAWIVTPTGEDYVTNDFQT